MFRIILVYAEYILLHIYPTGINRLSRSSYFLIKMVVSKAFVNTPIAHEHEQEMKVCTLTGIHYSLTASYTDTMSAFISWV